MSRSGVGSGGGYGSNKHVESRAPKVEPRARAIREQGVGQIGTAMGDHVTNKDSTGYRPGPLRGGAGYNPPYGVADPVKAVGVGGGRTIYKTGSQCQTGAPDRGSPGLPSTRGQWPD